MKPNILLVVEILSLVSVSYQTHWEIKGLHLYNLVPKNQNQVKILRTLRSSDRGASFINGIGEPNEPVGVICSPHSCEIFLDELKDFQLGKFDYADYVDTKLVANHVEIHIDNTSDADHSHHKDHGKHQKEAHYLSPEGTDSESTESQEKSAETMEGHHHDDNHLEIVHNTIPVRKVPGTNSLYTGIFYEIRMDAFPHGYITWTEKETANHDGNYVQIDTNPENLPHYKPGEKWYDDVQWALAPAEVNGYYNLILKGDLKAIVATSYENQTDYTHVVLAKGHNFIRQLKKTGGLRESALWKPLPTDHKDKFQLKLKRLSEDVSTITWTELKYGKYSHYIQVSTNPGHVQKYRKGEEWYIHTLFQFTPTELHLEAQANLAGVSAIAFNQGQSSNIVRDVKKKFRIGNYNPTTLIQKMNHEVEIHYSLELSVEDQHDMINLFDNIEVYTTLNNINIIPEKSTKDILHPIHFHRVQNSTTFTATGSCHWHIDKEIRIAPATVSEFVIFKDIAKNIELPVESYFVVSGHTDVIKGDLSSVTIGKTPAELVLEHLKKRGVNNAHKVTQDEVIVPFTGKLKGTFPLKAGVTVEEVGREIA